MSKAKKCLELRGHSLVPFSMPDSYEMMRLIFDFIFADKGRHLKTNWYVCNFDISSKVFTYRFCPPSMRMSRDIYYIPISRLYTESLFNFQSNECIFIKMR